MAIILKLQKHQISYIILLVGKLKILYSNIGHHTQFAKAPNSIHYVIGGKTQNIHKYFGLETLKQFGVESRIARRANESGTKL